MSTAYDVLGLPLNAARDEVKEAYRRMCKLYHPDLCSPESKAYSELKFREITSAYQTILKGQAGYKPPPPGSPPNSSFARAYYDTNWAEYTSGRSSGGRYGGYMTEWDYYRSWFKNTKNSSFSLSMAGLLAIPIVSTIVLTINGEETWLTAIRNDGLDALKESWEVNGQKTPLNPFQAAGAKDSYIYKHEKYAHLRDRKPWQKGAEQKQGQGAEVVLDDASGSFATATDTSR